MVLFLWDLGNQASHFQVAALVSHAWVEDIKHISELVLAGLVGNPAVGDERVVLLRMKLEASLEGVLEEGVR
jgi:hypothetical protein